MWHNFSVTIYFPLTFSLSVMPMVSLDMIMMSMKLLLLSRVILRFFIPVYLQELILVLCGTRNGSIVDTKLD